MDNERILTQIAAAMLMGVIYLLSHLLDQQILIGIYFFIPIALISWSGGLTWGIAFSLLATVMQLSVEFYGSPSAVSRLNLYINTFGFLVVFLAVAYLTYRFSEDHRRLLRISREDFLTGAMNRVGFYDVLNMEIRRQIRFGHPYTLAIVSCDHFKRINDTLGHGEGNDLLITVARTLELNTRTTDVVARLGSDEFALLFPLIMKHEAVTVLDKLKARLTEAMKEHHWDVTFSIAAIAFDKSPGSVGHALDLVDNLIRENKLVSKDSIQIMSYSDIEQAALTA
jgi:diguanylate cyclase (GGDEF)-like protein